MQSCADKTWRVTPSRICMKWDSDEFILIPQSSMPKRGGNNDSKACLPVFITLGQDGLVLSAGAGYPGSICRMWRQYQYHEHQSNPNANNRSRFKRSYRHSNQRRLNAHYSSHNTIKIYSNADGNLVEAHANSHKTAATYTDPQALSYADSQAFSYADSQAFSYTNP